MNVYAHLFDNAEHAATLERLEGGLGEMLAPQHDQVSTSAGYVAIITRAGAAVIATSSAAANARLRDQTPLLLEPSALSSGYCFETVADASV